ncbi:MAG: N-acetylmuramoyl-L-alanine amidase [Nocardioides sp.]|nr:N-acetylmuramoyl-L-alanine amidase [Nocardioides sp.]
MAEHSGWHDARRRTVVAVPVVGATALYLATRGDDATAPEGAATLSLAPAGGGVRAADIALAARADRRMARTAPRAAAAGVWRSEVIRTDVFRMVGVTWVGDPTRVRVKVHRPGTGWTPWRVLAPQTDVPDEGDAEDAGRTGTELVLTGRADRIAVELTDGIREDLVLTLIEPDGSKDTHQLTPGKEETRRNRRRPSILSRRDWGADESWRDGAARYNRTIQQMHVHHTVSSNDYSRDDVPGLIRGMYRYHTHNLGWSDIGYNFLVDRFGRIWLGRAGGAKRNVRGAHTLGFNHQSFGVSVIGNFETASPSNLVVTALVHLGAWKLHMHGRNPTGTVVAYSRGSDKYPSGRKVRLPTIDGHRDTNDTACPGRHLYARIPDVRRRAKARIARF